MAKRKIRSKSSLKTKQKKISLTPKASIRKKLSFITSTELPVEKIRDPKIKKFVEQKANEVKVTKKKLKENKLKLEKLNKEISTYTFISNHDIQEPLRKLQVLSSMMFDSESKNLSDNGKKYLQMISNSAKKIRELIRDLQEYTETRKPDIKPEKIDLNKILQEVKFSLYDLMKEKKARIYSRKLCKTTGVHYQFRKLFRDILINAFTFSKPDVPPRIFITSEVKKGNLMSVKGLSPKTRYCHLSFSDNGMGFDPKYNEYVFEIFKKLYKDKPGTGIGLAICKRIVENHNGVIKASGTPGKGTVIDVYIPY